MTPCEKLGYKVGDKFRMIKDVETFTRGMEVILTYDDGTDCPLFVDPISRKDWFVILEEQVEKIPQVTLTAKDWPDSPPGKIEHLEEVHHPQHYTDGEIECIDAIKAELSPEEYKGFLKGNAMKYIWRMNKKGKPSVDAKKALWYTDKLCGELE